MNENKLLRRQIIDPAVADLISGMDQKQAEMQMPRRERMKKKREQAKIFARREQRATYDLPPSLRQEVKQIAERERVPASQIVTLALIHFVNQYTSGQIDLSLYKQPSRSPRYDWNLILPISLIKKLEQ
ncbi:MAG: hypothetical protein HPY45_14025 [Anaerolineae bacterium]|nr:hypothetical protein [Anaerolineae bacterium]